MSEEREPKTDVVFDDPDTAYMPISEARRSRGDMEQSLARNRQLMDELRKQDSAGETTSPWAEAKPRVLKQGKKNKVAAGLMGMFLGAFGIHNFYLGRYSRGLVQLMITLLSGGMLSAIPGAWGFIEGLMILCSQRGSKWHEDGEDKELVD